jgi:CRISPR-associated protein Csb1
MDILDTTTIDTWADDLRGPVALHLRETLVPVEGRGSVVFPPTYAMDDKRNGAPYAIDTLADGTKVVQMDSVGSQANRMEPLFRQAPEGRPPNPLAALVPQLEVLVPDGPRVSILEVGHRLGDALIRASDLKEETERAFADFAERGDATGIAKLAPTSLVFGAWDSRGEGAKIPRLVQSVIRAWNVDVLKRSAQYTPALDYTKYDVFSEEDKKKAEGNTKSPLAERGFVHVPAVDTHGGVIVHDAIYRDVTINLVALRQLGAPRRDAELRRYILGLALVAATEPQDGFLRQGCLLTPDPDAAKSWALVSRDGRRVAIGLDTESALAYARKAAEAFGVGHSREFHFSKDRAKADIQHKTGKKKQA